MADDLRSQLAEVALQAIRVSAYYDDQLENYWRGLAGQVAHYQLPLIEAHMTVLVARADRAEQLLTNYAVAWESHEGAVTAHEAILDWYTEAVMKAAAG